MRPAPRWLPLGVALIAVAGTGTLAGCGGGPGSWEEREDPAGFTVAHPRGWEARRDAGTGRIDLAGPAGQAVTVWPVAVTTRARGGFDARAAATLLDHLAPRLWPETRWQPAVAGPDAARAAGRRGDGPAVAALTWAAAPNAVAGYVWAASAPEAEFASLGETFARIFASFRLRGAPAGDPAEPGMQFVRWQDPREQAFALDVPAGWQVRGGLFRHAAVDTRTGVEAVSPDGATRITLGDPELPPFTEPSPTLAMTGFTEGSWYSPGYGVRMQVRRYHPGREFVARYVRYNLDPLCTGITLDQVSDRDDAVRAVNAINARYGLTGVSVRLTAGEAHFTCRRQDRVMRGYYFAGTQLASAYGGGVWSVEFLYGFLTPAGEVARAQTAMNRMIGSFALNPDWARMQQHLTGQVSEIVAQTGNEIADMLSRSFHDRGERMGEIARRRSNATLGLEDVVDDATGREYKVESGSNYYWVDHLGNIVGTRTHTLPALDFRELVRLP